MTPVFADSFYFLALANRKDKAHSKCLALSQSSDRPVVTTAWVLMELGDALCRGQDRGVFALLVDNLAEDADTTVRPADQEFFDKAVALFTARPDKDWSLTDRTSFVLMHERGLMEALTSDHHFQQAGFTTLLT